MKERWKLFCGIEPSPQQKTLLVSIISLLTSQSLNSADKNALAHTLVLAGQTINAEIAFEDQKTAERRKAKNQIAKLSKEIAQLQKQLEQIKDCLD